MTRLVIIGREILDLGGYRIAAAGFGFFLAAFAIVGVADSEILLLLLLLMMISLEAWPFAMTIACVSVLDADGDVLVVLGVHDGGGETKLLLHIQKSSSWFAVCISTSRKPTT